MNRRRNLLVVLAHGLRSDALAPSTSWPLATPNLDRLVKRSLRLVATTACPGDWGGLLSLLSALHARQHGHVAETKKLPRCSGWAGLLAEEGYHLSGAGCVGPIHRLLKDSVLVEPVHVINSRRCAYLQAAGAGGRKAAVLRQRKQRLRSGPFDPDRLPIDPDNDVDGFIAQAATDMLANQPGDRPWAQVVIFTGPGNDLPPPAMYDNVVEPDDLNGQFVPADFRQIDALAELDYPRVMLQRLDRKRIGRLRADYLGRVGLFDYCIGRMLNQLAQRGDAERTWVIICSDHGQLLGEHGLVGHRSFLSGATEVPVIITPPTSAPQEVPDWLIGTVDVAATIADLGGCDLPPWLAGRSLLPILAGDSIAARHLGCISEFGKRLMLETERYKIIFDTDVHRMLGLYDLLRDAEEKTNLLDKPEGRHLVDAMRWRVGDALLPIRAVPAPI